MNRDDLNARKINAALSDAHDNVNDETVQKVLLKIKSESDFFTDEEAAILLYAPEKYHRIIFDGAKNINDRLYGNIRFFYGVVYVADFCIETCSYCGDNICSKRESSYTLSPKELKTDVAMLLQSNPDLKEICFLAGCNLWNADQWIEYLSQVVQIYNNEVSLNIAPFTIDEFRKIRQAFPNQKLQFRVFQETYDESIYDKLQPNYNDIEHAIPQANLDFLKANRIVFPPKKDFYNRLNSQERAIEAGFDNFGTGILFGLNDGVHKSYFEVLALKRHCEYLYNKYGKWPKTISFPRVRNSVGIDYNIPGEVSDYEFERIITVTRIILQKSHLVMTCRENAAFRSKIRPIINIEDFAARPGPGGNSINKVTYQMEIEDRRTGDEIRENILAEGYFIK